MMPELPEVETIARGLANKITGRKIERVRIGLAKMAVSPPELVFSQELIGEKIEQIGRRGKFVVMELASGRQLVTSLRMTGRLIVQKNRRQKPHPYTHIALDLSGGQRLCFADTRQFGRMRLVVPGERWDAALGLEPFASGFTAQAFIGMLSGRPTRIKALLLDQRRIAGIGNIYACEALWEARIRPDRPAGSLSKPAARRLHIAILDVLRRAVESRGTSVDDYVDAEGLQGGFQNKLAVYGRDGKPCKRCGRKIVRTVLAQRGTWWCRKCQR